MTPGLMVSKIKLRKHPIDRPGFVLGFVLGTGMPMATSEFDSCNHGAGLDGTHRVLAGACAARRLLRFFPVRLVSVGSRVYYQRMVFSSYR
jgi:hypothetical protein